RDRRRDGDFDRDTLHRHFGEFLNSHSEISERLARDPSLVKNHEFIESHPELKQYLNAHPDVQKELMADPHTFVKSSQQFTGSSGTAAKPPAPKHKPNPEMRERRGSR